MMSPPLEKLTDEQVRRYARHILLPEIGGVGQRRLLASAVRVEIGRSGAELVALAYLAAAGVGHLYLEGAVDAPIEANEVAAGIVFGTAEVGCSRLEAITARLHALNPDVRVYHGERAPASATRLHLDLRSEAIPTSAEDACARALIAGGSAAVQVLAQLTSTHELA